MTVQELRDKLATFDPDYPVMILDRFNGGGLPREINVGPKEYVVKKSDAEDTSDCESLAGFDIVVIGYGNY